MNCDSYNTKFKLEMNDNEPNANGQRNSEFIKSIKDKYTSARGVKASNNYGVSTSSSLYPEKS